MRREKTYLECLQDRLERYQREVIQVESLIQSIGPNNHLIGLEAYFISKVEFLKERLAQVDSNQLK